jgi:hypothetical protein
LRCSVPGTKRRNVLCIFPAYAPSFGTFAHAFAFVPGVRAFMPPQGLLIVAAYLPESWQVRFVDENIERADLSDFAWADVVFVGGMHIQSSQIRDIHRRARSCDKLTVLGGSAVSSSPDAYPEFDYLHIGEIGDATDRLIAVLDVSVEPPPLQRRFETLERLPLSSFPLPRYDAVPLAAISSARCSSQAAAHTGASFATFRRSMADSHDSSRPRSFLRSLTPSSPSQPIRRWFILSTTISLATAKRRAISCRI